VLKINTICQLELLVNMSQCNIHAGYLLSTSCEIRRIPEMRWFEYWPLVGLARLISLQQFSI